MPGQQIVDGPSLGSSADQIPSLQISYHYFQPLQADHMFDPQQLGRLNGKPEMQFW